MSTAAPGNELIGSVGGSFFEWLQRDILPHVSTGVNSAILSISVCVNIAFLVIYKKRRLYEEPNTAFIVQMAAVDLIACVFVLIFSIAASASGSWPLGEAGCYLQGVVVLWCFQLSFSLVVVCQVERTIRIYNHDLHMKTFNTVKGMIVASVVVWVVDLGIAVVPTTGFGKVVYDPDQYLCNFQNTSSEVYLHLQFAVTSFLAFLVLVITSAMMIEYKRRSAIITRQALQVKVAPPSKTPSYVRFKNEPEVSANAKQDVKKVTFQTTATDPKAGGKTQPSGAGGGSGGILVTSKAGKEKGGQDGRTKTPTTPTGNYEKNSKQTQGTRHGPGGLSRSPSRSSLRSRSGSRSSSRGGSATQRLLVFDIFSDDSDEKEFHLAVTYVITSVVLQFLWLSYLIAAYYDVYARDEIWRGAYTVAILLANVSYCVKPIIYLAHNKNYRRETIKTVPEKVKKKASEMSQSVGKTMDTIQKAVFVSPGGGGGSSSAALNQAMAVTKTLNAWKKKAIGSKAPVSPAPDKPSAKTPTPAAATDAKKESKPSSQPARAPEGQGQEVKKPARAAAHAPGPRTGVGRQRSADPLADRITPDERKTPLGTSVVSIDVTPSGKSSAMEMAPLGSKQKSSTTLGSASGVTSLGANGPARSASPRPPGMHLVEL